MTSRSSTISRSRTCRSPRCESSSASRRDPSSTDERSSTNPRRGGGATHARRGQCRDRSFADRARPRPRARSLAARRLASRARRCSRSRSSPWSRSSPHGAASKRRNGTVNSRSSTGTRAATGSRRTLRRRWVTSGWRPMPASSPPGCRRTPPVTRTSRHCWRSGSHRTTGRLRRVARHRPVQPRRCSTGTGRDARVREPRHREGGDVERDREQGRSTKAPRLGSTARSTSATPSSSRWCCSSWPSRSA